MLRSYGLNSGLSFFAAIPTQSYKAFLIKWGYDPEQADVGIQRLKKFRMVPLTNCLLTTFLSFSDCAVVWIKELGLFTERIYVNQMKFPAIRTF